MNHQSTFNFNPKENYENSDFFISNSNELAHKILLNYVNSEKYIYLKGPPKSGKTHLGTLWKKVNNAISFDYDSYKYIPLFGFHRKYFPGMLD